MSTAAPPRPVPLLPAGSPAGLASLSTAELVAAACAHDPRAWEEIVRRYGRMVRSVARSFRLSESDTADVLQSTWLRAVERLTTLREPDRLGGWLATTAHRECLAILRRSSRETADGLLVGDLATTAAGPETTVLAREVRGAVRRAVAELPLRRRVLVEALFGDPDARYADVARALDLPAGSIGPTRQRVLCGLRRTLERDGLDVESVA
jgi:RNA polymerase sigma factor (sigma-70 family)